jgi:3',5'-cyclic AMP phosphodiesterase CpdA
MKKIKIFLICLSLLMTAIILVPNVLADEVLISQTLIGTYGTLEYENLECYAQSFTTVTNQIDITRTSFYLTNPSTSGYCMAGISTTLTKDHTQWLVYESKSLNGLNGWTIFYNIDCNVNEQTIYYLMLKVTTSGKTVDVAAKRTTWPPGPYAGGQMYQWTSESDWLPYPEYDFTFQIWGNINQQQPQIQLTPQGYDFGSIPVGSCSSEYEFTLQNIGSGTATGTVSLTGDNPNQFQITSGGGYFSLSTGQTKSIKVRFCPTSNGDKSSILIADGENCNDDSSSLLGKGIDPPQYYTVFFDFYPYNTDSSISFNGNTYYYGDILTVPAGEYYITANPESSYKFSYWGSSCGTIKDPNSQSTYILVSKNGVLKVNFFAKQTYYFIHMTDTHIKSGYESEVINERFKTTLDHIRSFSSPPAFVVISGDLTENGVLSEFTVFKNYLFGDKGQFYLDFSKTIPIYLCPGNHDHLEITYPYAYEYVIGYPNENYKQCYKKDYKNSCRILSIDSGGNVYNPWEWVPPWDFDNAFQMPEGDGLCQETIDWLDNALNINFNNIIFMHHPAINYYATWNDGCIKNNLDQFLTTCKNNHVGLILSGHTHYSDAYEYKDGYKSLLSGKPPSGYDGNGRAYYLTNGIPSTYKRTLQIITPSVRDSFCFRNISVVDGDEIRVYFYEYASETSTADLIWLTGGGKGDPSEIANLSIIGNTRGELPGAYVINLTNLENNTYGKQASLLYGKDDYTFIIQGIQEGNVDFNCRHFCGKSQGEIMTYYRDVPITKGCIGKLYVYKDSIDHYLYIDNDGDGKPDLKFKPDKIECINVPYIPKAPSGPINGRIRKPLTFMTSTIDPEQDKIYYLFDWGDGTNSGWLGPIDSGSTFYKSNEWTKKGSYQVKVKAKDIHGTESGWSDPLTVNIHWICSRSVENNILLNWLLNHFPILTKIFLQEEL